MRDEHSFSIEYAAKYGVLEALIIKHFQYWIRANVDIPKMQIDGHTWTYTTVETIQKNICYYSVDQIRRAIKKLREANVILTANHNAVKYDRTTWYAFVDEDNFVCISKKSSPSNNNFEVADSPNGSSSIAEPIHNTNNNNNNTNICALSDEGAESAVRPSKHETVASAREENFKEFWTAYPRKMNKGAARKAYAAAIKKADAATILDAVRKFKFPSDVQFIPLPSSWLNGERWLDEELMIPKALFEKPIEYNICINDYQSDNNYFKNFRTLAELEEYIKEQGLDRTGESTYVRW